MVNSNLKIMNSSRFSLHLSLALAITAFSLSASAAWNLVNNSGPNGWGKVECESGSGWRKCSPVPPGPVCRYDFAGRTYFHIQRTGIKPVDKTTDIVIYVNNVRIYRKFSYGHAFPPLPPIVVDGVTYTMGALQPPSNYGNDFAEVCY